MTDSIISDLTTLLTILASDEIVKKKLEDEMDNLADDMVTAMTRYVMIYNTNYLEIAIAKAMKKRGMSK